MSTDRAAISPQYDRAIKRTFFAHVVIGLLAMLLLDFRETARGDGVALLAFWLSVALIFIRRPMRAH